MPGASLMMSFFGSPPRESRSASGPGTEADYQQGGGEDPGALRAARTSGKGREAGRPPSCTRRRRPTSRRSAEAADRNLTTRATQPTETGLAGWACRIRTSESVRELPNWICVTTSLEVDANRRRRPFAYELPGATRSIVEGCALRSGAARFQFRFAHRDQSQNPLRGRVLSPTRGLTDGAAGLPSLTEDRRKLFFPRARALLPSFLPSWPCKGSAELGGAAVVTSRSLGCATVGGAIGGMGSTSFCPVICSCSC
jgi:hypothetical protein